MARYTSRSRFVPMALILVIVVVAIAAIISLARAIFFSGGSSNNTDEVVTLEDHLLNTSVGRAVRMTVRGQLVADEKFYSFQIMVSPVGRSMTTFNGYLEQQIDSVILDNTTRAYEELVHALNLANFVEGTPFEGEEDDVRGRCARGLLYEFEILNNESVLGRYWTTTCDGSPGSLDANVNQISSLFINQIPNASDKLEAIELR